MVVYRQIVFVLKYDRAGVFQSGFVFQSGDNRVGYRPDRALLGNRCAEHALHAACGQEQRQIAERSKAARADRARALRALCERIECRAVVRKQEGAAVAGGFLHAALFDDQLAFVLLEVAHDCGRVRTHARVAGVGEVGRVVQAALPVAGRLVGVAGQKHTGVVLAAIQPCEAAAVDLVGIPFDRFGKGDGDIGQSVAVFGCGGKGHQSGFAVDRGNRHGFVVHRGSHLSVVQLLCVYLELGSGAVADERVDALGGQQIDRFVACAAAGRLRGDSRGRYIGDVLHAYGFPGIVRFGAAHRAEGLAVEQIEHAAHDE